MVFTKLKRIADNPYRIFSALAAHGCFHWLPDALYLKWMFRSQVGKWPDLDNPRTFNEKCQWLKLHDRKPEYTRMVDKYQVRQFVAQTIGENHLIPLLGVWETPEDIDFNALPEQFVLKCNHNSGLGMCICRDKAKLDIPKTKRQLRKGLQQNYYLPGREWPYQDVPRRIMGEQYIQDAQGDLKDYKFMCFDGIVRCSCVCSDRSSGKGLHVTFFDRNWNRMPFERHYPASSEDFPKPARYEEMITLAETLSKGLPFVRVDLYEIDGKVYFGELTFFPGSGFSKFTPEEWDHTLGTWLHVPKEESLENSIFSAHSPVTPGRKG